MCIYIWGWNTHVRMELESWRMTTISYNSSIIIFNCIVLALAMFSKKNCSKKHIPYSLLIVFIFCTLHADGDRVQLESNVHRTKLVDPVRDRWCYHCDTMLAGDRCIDVLSDNTTEHHMKCMDDERCMVRRYSLTTSTENTTSSAKLWLLQRTCVKPCEPGCIMIGERTKLFSCTTCCELDFCNSGSSTKSFINNYYLYQLNISLIITLTLKLIINYVLTE